MAFSTRVDDDVPRPHSLATAPLLGRATIGTLARAAVLFPLLVGLVHFLIVQIAASLALRYGTARAPSPPWPGCLGQPQPLSGLAHVVVEPLRLWDGLWYKLIAEHGYGPEKPIPAKQLSCAAGFGEAKAAFWPLYPWLMNGIHRVVGVSTDVAGYLLANVAFVVALFLLYRLVALDFDRTVARRTLWAIALFPTALFFSAVYTESLFLLLVVAALLAARLRNWWLAGVLGALAALTRSYGVLLLLPFAVLFLQQHRLDVRRWFPDALPAALPVLGPAIFAWWLQRDWHDPLASVHVQAQWNRFSATPWETFRCATRGCSAVVKAYGTSTRYSVSGADWGWVRTLIHHPTWSTITNRDFRYAVAQSNTLELVCTVLLLVLALFGLARFHSTKAPTCSRGSSSRCSSHRPCIP